MNPTRREKKRIAALDEIRSVAWKQIGESGAASISLRAIAREMGMTAPALYRYFKDRDALVTALLIDAFTAFRQALEAARDSYAVADHAGRLRGMCQTYFHWAAENPQRYALLFGTPIPGYLFTAELGPAAQRSFLVLQGAIGEAYVAGKISGEWATSHLPGDLMLQYERLQQAGVPYAPIVTHLALSIWSTMHGMTSLYLYQYLTGFLQQSVGTFVDDEIEKLLHMLGLV